MNKDDYLKEPSEIDSLRRELAFHKEKDYFFGKLPGNMTLVQAEEVWRLHRKLVDREPFSKFWP